MKELTELIGRKTTKAEKLTAPNPIFASDVRSAGMLAFFKPTMPVDSINIHFPTLCLLRIFKQYDVYIRYETLDIRQAIIEQEDT